MAILARVGSVFRGSMTLLLVEGVEKISIFLKSVIVARLIGPDEFGIASLFVITIALFEMMSGFSPEILMIQDDTGDEERVQSGIQTFQLVRGVILALLIFLFADLIAEFFKVAEASWAFRVLAIVPLLTGVSHLDLKRLQRNLDFSLLARVTVTSSFATTIFALPIAFYFRNHVAMLWLIILQSGLLCGLSHLVAERSYKIEFDLNVFRKIFLFGWPLLLNGLFMFGIFQGDRIIIGAFDTFTLRDMGIYSVAFSLTMVPALSFGRIANSFFIPLLAKHKNRPESFQRHYSYCNQVTAMASSIYALLFMVLGGTIVTVIYGAQYAEAASFIGWLAAMQVIRILRTSPTMAAISCADTMIPLYANLARTVAVPMALYFAAQGEDLKWIAISGFIGELVALGVLIVNLKTRLGITVSHFAKPAIVPATASIVGLLANQLNGMVDLWIITTSSLILSIFAVAVLYHFFTEFRELVRFFCREFLSGIALHR